MKDQEIIDNAPEGTTDVDDVNNYWIYQGNGDYSFWDKDKNEWMHHGWGPFHTRSLADIERIVELELSARQLLDASTLESQENAMAELEELLAEPKP